MCSIRKRVFTLIRRNFFTKDDGNFTADLQNVSLMSLDESKGKLEVNPKEEASVVEVFQDVLDKLSDSNGFPHLIGVEDPVKMSLSFFGPDINQMNRPPNNFLPNQKNWRVDGEYLIST
jgi:hypothetical protein